YGTDLALSRPSCAERATALARPGSGSRSQADRRKRCCGAEGENPQVWAVNFTIGHHGMGGGIQLPRFRQARWGQWCAHSPCSAEGLGSKPAGRVGEGVAEARSDSERFQRLAEEGNESQEGLAGGPDCSRRLRRGGGSGEEGGR